MKLEVWMNQEDSYSGLLPSGITSHGFDSNVTCAIGTEKVKIPQRP